MTLPEDILVVHRDDLPSSFPGAEGDTVTLDMQDIPLAVRESLVKVSIGNRVAFARKAMDDHGLTDWELQVGKAKRRAGCCKYRKRVIRFSKVYMDTVAHAAFANTVLHEIAHALVGPGNGHGEVWKAKAREIGCDARRCCDRFSQAAWLVGCPCGKVKARRHKVTQALLRKTCLHCKGKLTAAKAK